MNSIKTIYSCVDLLWLFNLLYESIFFTGELILLIFELYWEIVIILDKLYGGNGIFFINLFIVVLHVLMDDDINLLLLLLLLLLLKLLYERFFDNYIFYKKYI